MHQDHISDENILLQLKNGEETAFDRVFRQYYTPLKAFAFHYVGLSESEEIVQEVMAGLWEKRESLLPGLSLKSYLFTITRNRCLNQIEHEHIKQKVHEKLVEKYSSMFDDPDFYAEKELIARFQKALDALPEDYRKAFEWNRFEEMTYGQIAEHLGVSPKTIAYRISQALKLLRTDLQDYLPLHIFL